MKRIAIVAGGDSSEHDVSLRSAQGIWSFLTTTNMRHISLQSKAPTGEWYSMTVKNMT